MWHNIASFILKSRLYLLILTASITGFMGYHAMHTEITYDFLAVVPQNDPDFIYFKGFQKQFGEDGNLFLVGYQDKKIFELNNFKRLDSICHAIEKTEGINQIISIPTLQYLKKDTLTNKFVLVPLYNKLPQTQAELDSIMALAKDQKMYEGLIMNQNTNAMILAIALKKEYLNSVRRQGIIANIMKENTAFANDIGVKVHYAGLPYVRTVMSKEVKAEFGLFMALAAIVTSIILFLFFRSLFAVLFTFVVIGITVVWTMGTIVLLGYKMTLLTAMLPALIIVLSIPNCIYMYNKYHQEIRRHQNKVKALSRVIEKIGFLTFMTNINTAVGFFVLYTTNIIIIKEFGLVAGLLSIATFLISIIVIPILFSYLPAPNDKQLKHLDLRFLTRVNYILEFLVIRHRTVIYVVTAVILGISFYGISRIYVTSHMVDDLPSRSNVKTDLAFFEQHFKGIMPLEIVVDFNKKKAVSNPKNLKKLEAFQDYISSLNNVSAPISVVNMVKGAKQAFYGGDPAFYSLPTNNERVFLAKYLGRDSSSSSASLLRSFVDADGRTARFSCKVADLGTAETDELVKRNIEVKAKEIFEDGNVKVHLTGSTLLYLKGNQYLIQDLSESLLYAVILISLMMAMIYFNFKMVIISMIPNIIPMVITAGIMGLFNIPLKPSTALIFGISFGISIDSTIHFLSKYKQELKMNKSALKAIVMTLEESGVSMIYTSIVLFSGFVIFSFSDFGGTIALGVLTSITLFFAMFTNLILLPALILTFSPGDKRNLFSIVALRDRGHFHHSEEDDEELDLGKLDKRAEEKPQHTS
ncbi:MAG TPA: MMPL family transporter [Cytophagaceae bacterium]|jgi:predicted RND superfamily exporter protein|nr:MMPL family transporter [Cytophagaceae bacterium]